MLPNRHCEERSDEATLGRCSLKIKALFTYFRIGEGTFFTPGFTKRYNLHRLIYFERHRDMDSARRRERELKGKSRAKKDLLIKSVNPNFAELSPELI